MSEKYNGWSNYETWCVNLWLTNEEGSYHECVRLAEEAFEDVKDDDVTDAPSSLARSLESLVDEMTPDIPTGFASDLLRSALSSVDYYEIAEAFLDEVDGYPEAIKAAAEK
jgi:hypothetical protein